MKKLLLSLSVLAILGLPKISAQIIINSDFETWTTNALASSAKDPNGGFGTAGWWDFNIFNSSILGSSPITVFQDSTHPRPESGNYCAKIISQTMSSNSWGYLTGYGFTYPQTNGFILTGYINFSFPNVYVKQGIPCTNELSSFSFYYRYIPAVGGDTCSCTVAMYHFNSVTKKRDLVGGGYWSNHATVSAWTQATVNINYVHDSTSVDTMVILFSAATLKAVNNPKVGDTMNIDYSSVVLGINDVSAQRDNVTIYPNPANDAINLTITGQFQANRVEVYDITGKAIGTYTINNNFLIINTQSYSGGLYLYKLLDKDGAELNTGKFSVTR